MRVGLLEDEPDHAAMTVRALHEAGHSCHVHGRGDDFLRATLRDTFDVLILDWALPDQTGLQVLDALRQRQDRVPVLFLTSRDAEQDIVEALSHGADDYLVKPPRNGELLARLLALKRRADPLGENPGLSVAPYEFDPAVHTVTVNGAAVELSLRQFQLAMLLFRNRGRLLSRAYLLDAVWGLNAKVQTRTLDMHVSQLRSALNLPAHGWRITSVYAHGYRLEPLG
ncbi:MAG: response regulator transcription factor [Rhodoferax sp.]